MLDRTMYKLMSNESLRELRETAFRNAERALEKGFDPHIRERDEASL